MITLNTVNSQTKTCNNCYWWLKTGCENTNWKTGQLSDPTKPVCGYLTLSSVTPTSWTKLK